MSDFQEFLLAALIVAVVWGGFILKEIFTRLEQIEKMLEPEESDDGE
jgi:hypothetical protein